MGVTTGNFDFDLGGSFSIGAFALWNVGSAHPWSVRGFTLLAADNSAFTGPTVLGTYDANPNLGTVTASRPQAFTFAPTTAQYVRMVITSNNNGNAGYTIFKEAAFKIAADPGASAVPEPGSLLLFLPAMGVVAFVRRRKVE